MPEGAEVFDASRYSVVCELGRGGMGVVYLGRDLRREMDVAIKLCWRKHADAVLWLKREFRVVSSLRHPNLVELYELTANERGCYLTMEYIAGSDPREWVTIGGRRQHGDDPSSTLAPLRTVDDRGGAALIEVDFARVRSVLAQLAEALAFLHGRGVIHRDVKPSNVLVSGGVAKLLDFGIALERRQVARAVARERRVIGTAAYVAPEYATQLTVSAALDVYALGVLGFELVTGMTPFGSSPYGPGERRATVLPLASRINPQVPRELDELIDQMLSANPLRRPTAAAVAAQLSERGAAVRPPRHARSFVGRDDELSRLAATIAPHPVRTRFAVITGSSGVGKSALVDEAIGRARIAGELPELVWRGRCHERELVPYRAFDFVIDDLAGELARMRRTDEHGREPHPGDDLEHGGALGRAFPALAGLLQPSPAADDLRVERARAQFAAARLLDRVIGDRSGLIVIDDLQWADADSLELLATIVAGVTSSLAIIATWTEDGEPSPKLVDLVDRLAPRAERIAIAPLSTEDAASLIAAVAPAATAERVQAAAELAGGNPYLAELIARDLAATGVVDAHRAELRQLGRLTEPERSVAEIAALATGVMTLDQLRAWCELPAARLWPIMRALEDAHVLRASPSHTGEPVYAFYHQRLRDAAESAMADGMRRTLHLRFAELGEREQRPPDELAHHFERAGEPQRAARWAIAAGEDARRKLAWSVAVGWFERALAASPSGTADQASDCREQLAECLFLAGRLAEAARLFEQLAGTTEPAIRERWQVRAAEAHIKLGELDRGMAILDELLVRRGQPRARGRLATAVRTVTSAARILVPRPPAPTATGDPVLAGVYRVIASFLSTPYPIEAFEYVLRGIAAAERSGDRDARALGLAILAAYLGAGSLGRFGDRAIAAAQRLAVASDAVYPQMVAAGSAGIVAALRGDWAAMRRAHGDAARLCTRLGMQQSWEASFLRTYHALGEHAAGEPTIALAIVDELTEASDDAIARDLLRTCRGRALLVIGDIAAARAIEQNVARSPTAQLGIAAVYRHVLAGELALAEKNYPAATAIGHQLAALARRQWLIAIPVVSAMIDALIATGELASSDRAAVIGARRRAERLYRRGSVSFYAATALRLRGQAALRLGDLRDAERTLARAAEVAAVRGGQVDRLAIAMLRGESPAAGVLAPAIRWATAGMV